MRVRKLERGEEKEFLDDIIIAKNKKERIKVQ